MKLYYPDTIASLKKKLKYYDLQIRTSIYSDERATWKHLRKVAKEELKRLEREQEEIS